LEDRMRLKLLTNLNTLLLVAVCVALGATLWWSQRALERPYLLMERYLGLSQQFQNEARATSRTTWPAAMPCALQRQWRPSRFAGHLATCPRTWPEPAPQPDSLEAFSKTELLAAGKLAGDPQALLLQAERELGANLEQLPATPATAAMPRRRYLPRCSPPPSTWASCPWPATSWSAAAARNWPTMSSAKCNIRAQAQPTACHCSAWPRRRIRRRRLSPP
jgi:hypothetical protein